MPDHLDHERDDAYVTEEPVSVSHLVQTLRHYMPAISLWLAAVVLIYLICAVIAYLVAPSQRITSLPFRLDFEGASRGEYPNGIKFSPAEITATPVLLRVYQDNDLKRFIGFETFARSVFVLESNREYDQLAAEYQTRLADPKLSPVDRERIAKEFEVKRASLNKSGYSLSFVSSGKTASIPRLTLAKVLSDVLATWARQAAVEKRVLDYRTPALSINILQRTLEPYDYFISLVVLRSKINDIVSNIEQLSIIPGIELVRVPSTHASLAEVALEIRDITRFRIEPLIARARTAGLARNSAGALQVLTSQLEYDTRMLNAAQRRENALKDALATYQEQRRARDMTKIAAEGRPSPAGETVMPQISESFLDRIVDLTNQTADRQFRQDLVNQIKKAALQVVPLQTSVSYDQQLVNEFKAAPSRGAPSQAEVEAMRRQWDQVYAEVAKTIGQINEIYVIASKQLNPVTELFTVTSPIQARVDRAVSLSRLLLYGILVFLISIPVVIGGALIHNRIHEEELAEGIASVAASDR